MANNNNVKNLIMKAKYDKYIDSIKNYEVLHSSEGCYKHCYSFKDCVVLESKLENKHPKNPSQKQLATARLKATGFKTPKVVYFTTRNNIYYEVQEKVKGAPVFYNQKNVQEIYDEEKDGNINKFLNEINKERFIELISAPNEHFSELIENFFKAEKLDLLTDCHSSNIHYDRNNGFTFIDLPDIPYFESVKDYENEFKNFNNPEILNRLPGHMLYAFRGDWSTAISYRYEGLYYNLLSHKFLNSIDNSRLGLSNENLEKFKNNFFGYFDTYYVNAVSDYSQKLTLIKMGLLTPSEKDQAFIDEYHNGKIPLDIPLWEKDEEFEQYLNKDFYIKCINSSTINNKQALDYFNEIEPPENLITDEFEM